jgi:hypothetical protein
MAPKPASLRVAKVMTALHLSSFHARARILLNRTGFDGNPWTPLVVDGKVGPPENGQPAGVYLSQKAWQWKSGNPVQDGRWGPNSMAYAQRYLGNTPDGVWDFGDTETLQARCSYAGFPCGLNGVFASNVAEALQLSLNSGRF